MPGQNGAPSGGLPPDVQAAINISLGAVLWAATPGCTSALFRTIDGYSSYLSPPVSLCVSLTQPELVILIGITGPPKCIWVYDWAVTGYANPGVMAVIHWALPAEAMFMCDHFSSTLQLAHAIFRSGTTGTLVQCFYAWRVWLVSTRKNWILPVIIAPFAMSYLWWQTISWFPNCPSSRLCSYNVPLLSTSGWEAPRSGADVLITISMIYYLDLRFRMKEASRVGPGTNRTVECNVLSTLTQATMIGVFQTHSLGLYFVLGRRSNGTGPSGFPNSSKSGGEQHGLSNLRGRNQNSGAALEVAINVQREIAEDSTGWDKTSSDFDQVQKV
ncbi:hypothetical protein DFH08DRAFT_816964 [Mycena albidolilacea]|uniref:Uncharacterized protein n=1 Tax=Mycena albidolilacea TaxID=1033008 RepID=A0AAD6ZKE5_9AGAR|nr:hypothetical protein DFH08DRAFT_816964 [Mycena albidolilacea]